VDRALSACIPADRHDHAAVRAAEKRGLPAIAPILPQLLAWLRDINWPVARDICVLLRPSGPEIAPHLLAILRSDDAVWSYWVIVGVIGDLPHETWVLVADDMHRIATNPTPAERAEEVDRVAQEALANRSRR
jgi:Domain of unknown function (DUF5071)